jgi:hypothetical protein
MRGYFGIGWCLHGVDVGTEMLFAGLTRPVAGVSGDAARGNDALTGVFAPRGVLYNV